MNDGVIIVIWMLQLLACPRSAILIQIKYTTVHDSTIAPLSQQNEIRSHKALCEFITDLTRRRNISDKSPVNSCLEESMASISHMGTLFILHMRIMHMIKYSDIYEACWGSKKKKKKKKTYQAGKGWPLTNLPSYPTLWHGNESIEGDTSGSVPSLPFPPWLIINKQLFNCIKY